MTAEGGHWGDGGSWASLSRKGLNPLWAQAALRPVRLTTRTPALLFSFLHPVMTWEGFSCAPNPNESSRCWKLLGLRGCTVSLNGPERQFIFLSRLYHGALCLLGLKGYLSCYTPYSRVWAFFCSLTNNPWVPRTVIWFFAAPQPFPVVLLGHR